MTHHLSIQTFRILCWALFAFQVAACSSPTGPDECGDPQGRSPISRLELTCVARGSGLGCESVVVQSGYCARGPRNVTATARWLTTNSAVGVFTAPGVFEFRGQGSTVIYAESIPYFYSQHAYGYQVDAGGTPQQIGVVDIMVRPAGGGILPQSNVEFSPQTGDAQHCQTGFGMPYSPCRFWSDLSPAVVRVSKPGYIALEQSITPRSRSSALPLHYPKDYALSLRPVDLPPLP